MGGASCISMMLTSAAQKQTAPREKRKGGIMTLDHTQADLETNATQDPQINVALDDQDIKYIESCLRENDYRATHSLLEGLTEADIAQIIAKLGEEDRLILLNDFFDDIPSGSFTYLDPELCKMLFAHLQPRKIATILSQLDSDDALDLVIPLDEEQQNEVMRKLSSTLRLKLEEGLSFPEDSAGRLMQREVVAVPQFWTVGKTVDYLRRAGDDLPGDFFDIFVITPSYHIVGQVPLAQLIRAKRHIKLQELAMKDVKTVQAETDQEEVAHIFRNENIISAAVVDEEQRLIGMITIDDVLDVIDEEAQEDIMKMAGVEQNDLYRAVFSTTGRRFRWLLLNLLTAILASVVISWFDATIQELVALAVLMPIVASMGGNAGTQTLAVAVRALAMKELSSTNSWRIIWKESLIGLINGALFAVISGAVAGLWFQNPMLGVVIGFAMIVNLIVAGFFGALIPIAISKQGSDPAVSSTVFLTTLTDIVGFFVFLGLASAFLL